MKRIFIYIFVTITLLSTSCESVLNVEPENSVTFMNYFKSVQDAEALLANMEFWVFGLQLGSQYVYPRIHCYAGILADKYTSGVVNARDMRPSTYINSSSTLRSYQCLESAHLIIDNAHRFPSDVDMRPYVLQAHFVRAMIYYHLAREWGEVPIVEDFTNYIPLPQSPVEKVLEEAEKSALIALELPVYEELKDGYGQPRTSKQYASKGAVAALLANIYAWRAAVENEPKYWEEAEKYCSMIIENKVGNYSLAADPNTLCNVVLKGESDEGIWEILNTAASGQFSTSIGGQYAYREQEFFSTYPVRSETSMKPNSNSYTTQFYKERVNRMFDKADRRRNAYFYALDADSLYVVYDSKSGKMVQAYSEKEGATTRYYRLNRNTWEIIEEENLLKEGDTLNGKGYDNKQIKMAFAFKYRHTYYTENASSREPFYCGMEMNRVVWRLADIYLLRAECRAYRKDPKAAEDLNYIRWRAYGNYDHDYTAAEGDIKLVIFREREKELLFEDHRWYDVVRNGWNHLHGHVDHDFIREELSLAYRQLTNQDILDGALFLPTDQSLLNNNELIRQNVYWNKKSQ